MLVSTVDEQNYVFETDLDSDVELAIPHDDEEENDDDEDDEAVVQRNTDRPSTSSSAAASAIASKCIYHLLLF